jgi:hypothetical protein
MTSSNLGQSAKKTEKSTITRAKKAGAASLAGSVILGMLAFSGVSAAVAAEPSVPLATAEGYSVLAGTTVTNTGSTVLSDNLGVSPGTAITGFPPGIVGGTVHAADGPALQAQSDLAIAYTDATNRQISATLPEQIAGTILEGGVYESWSGKLALDGTVTFDGQNDPNSVFIMKSASTLITGSASKVAFINGAQACNVFWQVGSSATLGTDSTFAGTVLARTSITANNGATIEGRALALNGAVTLDNNVFIKPSCDVPIPTPSATPSASATATTPAVIPSPAVSATATTAPIVSVSAPTTRTDTGTSTGADTDTGISMENGAGSGTEIETSTEAGTDSSATRLADTGVSTMTPLFAGTGLALLFAGLGLFFFGNRKTARKH